MSQFPDAIFTPRATENLPGLTYDANNKRNMFSEDFQNLGNEINAVETFIGVRGENVPRLLARNTELNGTAGGRATLYTVPAGYSLQITDIFCRALLNGVFLTAPSAVFTNGETEVEIGAGMSSLTKTLEVSNFLYTSRNSLREPEEVVRDGYELGIDVTEGTFLGDSPTCSLVFDLIGYLVPIE